MDDSTRLERLGARRPRIALTLLGVRTTGVCDRIEALVRPRQGRNRDLTVEGFLAVLILTFEFRHSLEIAELAHTYLTLPPAVQRRFGVPAATAGRPDRRRAMEDHCYRLWERLGHALDADPVTRPWLLPDQRAQLREEVASVMNCLASGIVPRSYPRDALAADGTAVHSFGNRKFGGDPQARVGIKTPTDADPLAKYFGFKLVAIVSTRIYKAIATTIRTARGTVVKLPSIILAHELLRATADEGIAVPRILRRSRSTLGVAGTPVATDRLPSYSERYAIELIDLDIAGVHDLHPNLVGQAGTVDGALLIDNFLWCPAMPALYWNLSRGARGSREGRAAGRAGMYREDYAAHLLSYSLQEGAHFLCPLRSGTLGVPGKPPLPDTCPFATDDEPTDLLPETLCGADEGIVVPLVDVRGTPTDLGRRFTPVVRLGREWLRLNPMPRALVENVFSTTTTRKGQNLARGQSPAIGLPGNAVVVAIVCHLHNRTALRKLAMLPSLDGVPEDLRADLRAGPVFASPKDLMAWYGRLFPA